MVHEEITIMSENIAEKESKLKEIMNEVIDIDSVRLQRVLNISVAGLSFDKVWETKKTSVAGENEISKVTYTYLEKNGKKLRALKLLEYKGEGYSKDDIAEREDKYELWLTPNSYIKTHVFGESIKELWGRIDLRREVINYDYDPLTLNQSLEYEWDIDLIIESICNHLKERNNDLEYRIVKQSERLAEIKKLHIL